MLGSAIARTLPKLRAEAESRMNSTCSVTRPGETGDPITGTTSATDVWSGKCRVKSLARRQAAAVDVSTSSVTIIDDEVHVPVHVGPFRVGDVVEITASPNPLLVGVRYRITSLHEADDTTAQRLPVERLP